MDINIIDTKLDDILIIKNDSFKDERGFFLEVYRKDIFKNIGLDVEFVQLNHSGSVKNVTRGLHFQWDPQMGKLMRVTKGEVFLVAVDIRINSKTLGKSYTRVVKDSERIQIWAPAGFARGFSVISEYAEIQYLCTGVYNQHNESGILWNDSDLSIDWPTKEPILSEKDKNAITFKEWLKRDESKRFKK